MYKKEGGYRETTYKFPDTGRENTTTLFLNAIFEEEYRPIKQVILVGTRTSSWDMFIADPNNNEDLFLKIHEDCRNKEKGIDADSIIVLEKKLSEWHNNIPFKIIVHTNEINQENVEKIFSAYGEIPKLLASDTGILFDISHGFRSMPLLVFQSLQLNASKIFGRRVELIYGEYIEDEKISYVRDLSKYWEYYEIGSAIKLFEEKLDGKILAEKIMPFWESGAKFLIRLSEIVECNFSLQIPEALKQLKNAIVAYTESGNQQWVTDVKDMLVKIYNDLSVEKGEEYPVARTIWKYSNILREKKLITQAVIALHVVVETIIAEKFAPDQPEKIGDYRWFNGYYDEQKKRKIEGVGEKKLRQICKKNKQLGITISKLEGFRNRIAHGGGKDKKGNYPHQANTKGILEPIDNAIRELFTVLG